MIFLQSKQRRNSERLGGVSSQHTDYLSRDVSRHLYYARTEPFGVEVSDDGILFLPLKVTLSNVSAREIFFNVKRSELVLNGLTNKETGKGQLSGSIPPGKDATFRVAAVPKLKAEHSLNGTLELEIEYASRSDDRRYLLHHRYAPWFRFAEMPSTKKPFALTFDGHLEASQHKKGKWW